MPLDRPRRPPSSDAARLEEIRRRAAGLRRRRHRLVGGGAAAVVAAAVAVVLVFALPPSSPTSVKVTGPRPASTTTPTAPSRSTVRPRDLHSSPPVTAHRPGSTTTLGPSTTVPSTTVETLRAAPVVSCPTTFGITPAPHPVKLPATVSLTISSTLADQVAVYTDNQGRVEVVAPKGWRCTADYGADGSGGVVAYPAGESVPSNWGAGWQLAAGSGTEAVVGTETSACVSCTTGQACPLFASAARAFRSQLGRPCPRTRPKTETVATISTGIVAFRDPPGVPGDGLPSGGADPANGVMTYHSPSGDGSWLETCTLPAAGTQLCSASLNRWVAEYGAR